MMHGGALVHPLAAALLRDKRLIFSTMAAALALSLALALAPLASEVSQRAAVESAGELLQPLVRVHISYLAPAPAAGLNESIGKLLEAAKRIASRVPGGGGALWAPALVVAEARCGGGGVEQPGYIEAGGLRLKLLTIIGDEKGQCAVYGGIVAAYSPVPGLHPWPGLRLLAGRWPSSSGEVAVGEAAASLLGARVGGVLGLGGLSLRVVGLYREAVPAAPPGLRGYEVSGIAVAGPRQLALLLEALGRANLSEQWRAVAAAAAAAMGLPLAGAPPGLELLRGASGELVVAPLPALVGQAYPYTVSLVIGYRVEAGDPRTLRERADAIAARVSEAAGEAERELGVRVYVENLAGELAGLASVSAQITTMFLSAGSLLLIFLLGFYSAVEAVEASASRLRGLAALLALRGAPSRRLLRLLQLAVLAAVAPAVLLAALLGYFSSGIAGAVAALLALLVLALSARRAASRAALARPVEAVRPVSAGLASTEAPAVRGRVGGVLAALALTSVALGLLGLPPERLASLAEAYGSAAAATVVVLILVSGIMLPLAPAILALWLAELLHAPLERVYRRTVFPRIVGLLSGRLGWIASREASRLWSWLLSRPGQAAYASAAVVLGGVGASLFESYASVAKPSTVDNSVGIGVYAAYRGAAAGYMLLALFSLAVLALSLYSMVSAASREALAETVTVRVRGAGGREARGLAAVLLAAGPLYSVMLGIVVGLASSLAVLAGARLFYAIAFNSQAPWGAPGAAALAPVAMVAAAAVVYPLLEARRVSSAPLARSLRGMARW